jgi:hypothetical protein
MIITGSLKMVKFYNSAVKRVWIFLTIKHHYSLTHHHDFYDFKKTVLRTFEGLNNATLSSLSDNFSINPVVEAYDENDWEKNNGQNAT